jgi:selT/selW/selH-like putative selenoprotein
VAAAIRKAVGVEPEIVKGDGGVFDVEVDDRLVFSKRLVGRFPEDDEIVRLLRR